MKTESRFQMNNMTIRLYMTVPTTEALGPGKRYAMWVQGCNKRCIGCIAPDAQPLGGGYTVSVKDLAEEILSVSDIEGITISGGEPFQQQNALRELIDILKARRDLGVIIYTGMKYEDICDTVLAKHCDLIIDGEYVESLNDGKSLRGSSNQSAIYITDRYKSIVDKMYGANGRKIEFVATDGKIHMIGIPSRNVENMVK